MNKRLKEQIAQEICKGICGEDSWEGVYPHRIDTYRSIAEATMSIVLAALQEPTYEMATAMGCEWEGGRHYRPFPDRWKSCLSASALGESKLAALSPAKASTECSRLDQIELEIAEIKAHLVI